MTIKRKCDLCPKSKILVNTKAVDSLYLSPYPCRDRHHHSNARSDVLRRTLLPLAGTSPECPLMSMSC